MGEMMEQICQWDNLLLAYQRASRSKRGKGAVAAFETLMYRFQGKRAARPVVRQT